MAKRKKAKKRRKVKNVKPLRQTWYVFGLRPDEIVEFIKTLRAYSAKQAESCLRKKYPKRLRSLSDDAEYVKIWAQTTSVFPIPDARTGQFNLLL